MLIAITNNSTLVKDADLDTICQAIQIQLDLHVLPAWNLKAGTISFYADATKVPGYAWNISVIDDDTQVPGALGFHQEETSGKIDGFIMAKPILDNGGSVLTFDPKNPGNYTVSGTISHEAIETIGDRFTNCYYDCGGTSWCGELCDPVEQIGYGIMVGTQNVAVSDFVFPNFFNPYAKLPESSPLNYLKTVKEPFTILAGGYAIERTGGPGTEQQVFSETYPAWKKELKKKSFTRANRIVSKTK